MDDSSKSLAEQEEKELAHKAGQANSQTAFKRRNQSKAVTDFDVIEEQGLEHMDDNISLPNLHSLESEKLTGVNKLNDQKLNHSMGLRSVGQVSISQTRLKKFNQDLSGKSRIVSITDKAAMDSSSLAGDMRSLSRSGKGSNLAHFEVQAPIVAFPNGALSRRRVHADGLKMLANRYELIEEKSKL